LPFHVNPLKPHIIIFNDQLQSFWT